MPTESNFKLNEKTWFSKLLQILVSILSKLFRPFSYFGKLETTILILGILVIVLLLSSLVLVSASYVQQSRLDAIANELKLKLSLAHIWSEQAMAGDLNIDFQTDVQENMDKSLQLCNIMLNGGQVSVGYIEPIGDDTLKSLVTQMCDKAQIFNNLTRQRWDSRFNNANQQPIDQTHDLVFKEVVDIGGEFDITLDKMIVENQLHQFQVNSGIVFFLVLIFGGMIVFVKINRKTIENQTAILQEKEKQYRSIFQATSDGMCLFDPDTLELVEANDAFYIMHGYEPGTLAGKTPATWLPPEFSKLPEEATRIMMTKGIYETDIVHLRKDGTQFYSAVRCSLFNNFEKSLILVVIRDITERIVNLHKLEKRVAERTHELYTLLQISQDVAATLELQPLLGLILDKLKQVVDYSGATIFNTEAGELDLFDQRGSLSKEQSYFLNQVIVQTGLAATNDKALYKPLIVDELSANWPELLKLSKTKTSNLEQIGLKSFQSLLFVPLLLKDQLNGGLLLLHEKAHFYNVQHSDLLQAVANQASVALENARLYKQAQQLAVVEERQRLARELHDSVTQALYGIALGAQTARSILEDGEFNELQEPLDYILSLSKASLAEMRSLIFAMRPETLENRGLLNALSDQAETLKIRHKIEVKSKFDIEPPIPLEAKQALYRIAQEALNNVVKHSEATSVSIELRTIDETVNLEIRDNGKGFDTERYYPGHMGLSIMRERISSLGGSIDLVSSPDQGVLLKVTIPVIFNELNLALFLSK